MIHPYCGVAPNIHHRVFVAEGTQIIGDVILGKDSSVWFNAVIRADVNYIRIGECTNIQDGRLLHVRHKTSPLIIGSHVTVGHGAIAHGCTIHDYSLIGMGSIVLDNAKINSYTLVVAGAVVLPGTIVPEGGHCCRSSGKSRLRTLSSGTSDDRRVCTKLCRVC